MRELIDTALDFICDNFHAPNETYMKVVIYPILGLSAVLFVIAAFRSYLGI